MSWKTILLITIGVLSLSATKVWFDKKDRENTTRERDAAVIRVVTEINRTSPRMVDELTRLDSAAFALGRLNTIYTLPKNKKTDIDVSRFTTEGRRSAVVQLCKGKDSRLLLKSGLIYGYTFRDAAGSIFSEFQVMDADCPTKT